MRVGIIGSGGIAQHLAGHISTSKNHELAFVMGRTLGKGGIVTTTRIDEDILDNVDVVVEASHPDMVRSFGESILARCSLMVLSCSALVDNDFRHLLTSVAENSSTSLVIPAGALVGLGNYRSNAAVWATAEIEFVKDPQSIEPRPADFEGKVVLYEGAVRGIAEIYPRNVNAMVAFALATVGLDKCHARLIGDKAAKFGQLRTTATGHDGSKITVIKQQPMQGVSGTEMGRSVIDSLELLTQKNVGLTFV